MARPQKTPQRDESAESAKGDNLPNPVWFKPVMFGFMLLGLAWIIVYYLSQTMWPIQELGVGNLAVGFGLLLIGFFMTTRWR